MTEKAGLTFAEGRGCWEPMIPLLPPLGGLGAFLWLAAKVTAALAFMATADLVILYAC